MKKLALLLPICIVSALAAGLVTEGLYNDAKADGAAEVRAELDAGVAAVADPATSPPSDPTAAAPADPKPSDAIDDPTQNPGAYFDDVKAAKKTGWALFVLVLLRGLLAVLGTWIPYLRKGKNATVLAGAGAVVSAAFDSMVLGGTWVAAVMAAVGAALWYFDGHAKPKTSEGT